MSSSVTHNFKEKSIIDIAQLGGAVYGGMTAGLAVASAATKGGTATSTLAAAGFPKILCLGVTQIAATLSTTVVVYSAAAAGSVVGAYVVGSYARKVIKEIGANAIYFSAFVGVGSMMINRRS